MQSTHYSSRILMKLEFSRQIVENVSNTKFHQDPSSWSRVVHSDRETDGRAFNSFVTLLSSCPHSPIWCFLFRLPVSPLFLKIIR
jgi:hypothetical protein